MLDSFQGYWRADGRAGTRNHVLVLPLCPGANRTASLVRERVEGVVGPELHQDFMPGEPGYSLFIRTLAGWVDHPNVYAAVLVTVAQDDPVMREVVGHLPSHVKWFITSLEEAGGTVRAAAVAEEYARRWVAEAEGMTRTPIPLENLLLATECGGSDACSGLSANPALGFAGDLLIARGGSSILAETTELIGAEHLLAARAVRPEVAWALLNMVTHAEAAAMRMGVDFRGAQPAPGNIAGGITTIEEKSLGCVHKGGLSPLTDVTDYAQRPRTQGLVVMDTPGHDVMQLVGMAAAGAQVMVFTTGRGTPTGSAICPVIKVSTRSALKASLPDVIDLDAGPVVDGHLSVASAGWQLFRKIVSVASGEQVAAERLGHREFGIFPGWEVGSWPQ